VRASARRLQARALAGEQSVALWVWREGGGPKKHWVHLRTTNIIESPFAAVRLRTTAAKRYKKVEHATALIWKVLGVTEWTFRRLNAPELLPTVFAGVSYSDGVAVTPLLRRIAT
jgi:hypothetical protein